MLSFGDGDLRNWFFENRFGLFVHWGIYAVGGRHEQEQMRYHVAPATYQRYAKRFNPAKFDPAAWLDMARSVGMEYLVFTVKHHDGFCLWDTKETDYNVMNTPYGKDILRLLADECHRQHFPLELYYSCVDWHHPAYPNQGRHHEITTDASKHDLPRYMDFLKRQIRELCTNYGELHGIWWDMNVPQLVDPTVNQMIRELQPKAVINNRGYDQGDYSTPERNFEAEALLPYDKPTEACDSVGMGSWGYRKDEDYFSVRKLERQIALNISLGGNFLLNAGPKADGCFPAPSRAILKRLGTWFAKVGDALRATPAPHYPFYSQDLTVTASPDGKTLNLIFLAPPKGQTLVLHSITKPPKTAHILNTGAPVSFSQDSILFAPQAPDTLRLTRFPANRMNDEVMIIQLNF